MELSKLCGEGDNDNYSIFRILKNCLPQFYFRTIKLDSNIITELVNKFEGNREILGWIYHLRNTRYAHTKPEQWNENVPDRYFDKIANLLNVSFEAINYISVLAGLAQYLHPHPHMDMRGFAVGESKEEGLG